MQADEGDLVFTPSILDTPSLMTPNIVLTAPTIKSNYDPLHTSNESLSTSNASSIMTNETSSTASSADAKVSKIEDQLKRSLTEARKPTPSPFETISTTRSVFILDKPTSVEDGTTIEIPSTADVVKDLEALTNTNPFQIKTLMNENNERGGPITLNGDQIRYDSSPTMKGPIVSPPKKNFLIRSQSHTEPTSPLQTNPNLSQSQKTISDNSSISNTQNGFDDDDDDSMDDTNFTRNSELISVSNSNDQSFKPTINNVNDQQLNSLLRIDQTIIKQQPQSIVINNKRTFVNNIPPMTKTNTIIIPPSTLNEVTSTDQSASIKRQRTGPISSNSTVINFRPSTGVATVTNPLPNNGGSDDQRKKQIRDSNREAARRCRERRRQYIEQLEGNLEHHKGQIKQLTEKLARVERENTQLRAILTETKILPSSSRISLNESHIDYVNVISASGMELHSESTNGGPMTRSYINRNNL